MFTVAWTLDRSGVHTVTDPTPDEQILETLETQLAENAGVSSVQTEGQSITFDPRALELRDKLARRAAAAAGKRPRVSQIYLGGS